MEQVNLNIHTGGCVDVIFHDFIRGLIHATLNGNVLSMVNTPGAFLFDHERPAQTRGSELYGDGIDTSVRPAIVTGTPGTGKTMLRNYVAYTLIHRPLLVVGDRRLILFQTGDCDKHYKIVMVRVADTATPAGAAIMNIDVHLYSSDTFDLSVLDYEPGEVYRLIDVHMGKLEKLNFDTERVIIFSSPNSRLEYYFVKYYKARILYMPLWSRLECIDADTVLKLHLGNAVITQRHTEAGGVAQFVLELVPRVYQRHLECTLAVAADVIEDLYVRGRAFNDIPELIARHRHSLIYYEVQLNVDGTHNFKCAVANFGTKCMLLLVGKELCDQLDKVLDLENMPYRTLDRPSIQANIASRMAERGLEGLVYATLGKPPTATKQFLVNFDTGHRFDRAYVKQYVDVGNIAGALAAAPAGTMLLPNSLYYPTIDFILVSDVEPGGARLYAFVQVAVARQHEVGADAAPAFMDQIQRPSSWSVLFCAPGSVQCVYCDQGTRHCGLYRSLDEVHAEKVKFVQGTLLACCG